MLAFREFYKSKHSLRAKWENYKDWQGISEEIELPKIQEYFLFHCNYRNANLEQITVDFLLKRQNQR